MKKLILPILGLLILVAGCSEESTQQPAEVNDEVTEQMPEETEEPDETESAPENEQAEDEMSKEWTVLAENLVIPWSIEKKEDVFYISERDGAIAKIEDGAVERQDVQLEQELSLEQEAGLLGFVLDPDFDENQQAIAYYTYAGNMGPTNRIVRLQLAENVWIEVETLLDEIPSGAFHHGGRLAIGPDEKLYATAGDAANPDFSQDLDSLAGKILRLNLDGSIPEDNPDADSYIYSYGHRNAQGLTWLDDGTMYATEHGNQANDEINLIEAGENYGWPIIEGTEEASDMQTPIFTSGFNETWAPSGMANQGTSLYVAALRGNAVLEFDLENDEIKEHFTEYGRIRDVYVEDDFLYFITNNTDGRGDPAENDDRLIRIGLSELE